MKKILFIIGLDKFTEELYLFFENNFQDQENYYVFYGNNHKFDFFADSSRCFYINNYKEIDKGHKIIKIANECDLIIYSGLFGSERFVIKLGFKSLSKTYIQFWGGDFYCFRNTKNLSLKEKLSLLYKKYIICNAKGVINLIPNEYSELCKYVKPKGKNFIAPVCGTGKKLELVKKHHDNEKSKHPIKILLGNSATESNQHMQTLSYLEKYKEEDFQIICPLSYGDNKCYKDSVIEYGKKLFNDKFTYITEYMDLDSYFKIISECTIAIFNNNRQQAMGNIDTALGTGCKVFLRNDTPMWELYQNEFQMIIYDVDSIPYMSFKEFLNSSIDMKKNNYENYLSANDSQKNIIAWQKIFDSFDSK